MCGLFGLVDKKLSQEKRSLLLRALCVLNTDRGDHGAGLFAYGGQGTGKIYKSILTPAEFVEQPRFKKACSKGWLFIGHTRFATKGAICKANQHPFRIGKIVGAHNGVVSNLWELEHDSNQDLDVDSQYLIWYLNHTGTIGPASGSLNVSYWDQEDPNRVRLLRWNNPLHFAELTTGGYVWSSQEDHLMYALAIADVDYEGIYELQNRNGVTLSQDFYHFDQEAPEYEWIQEWSKKETKYDYWTTWEPQTNYPASTSYRTYDSKRYGTS